MVEWTVVFPSLVAIILAVIPAPYLHEGSHWFVGWLGNTKPTPHWTLWIFPNRVSHGAIETMDSGLIRLSGFAPFVWIPVGILATIHFSLDSTPGNLFAMLVPLYVVFLSTESDAIAVRNPERYRKMEINGDLQRNPLFLPNWVLPEGIQRF